MSDDGGEAPEGGPEEATLEEEVLDEVVDSESDDGTSDVYSKSEKGYTSAKAAYFGKSSRSFDSEDDPSDLEERLSTESIVKDSKIGETGRGKEYSHNWTESDTYKQRASEVKGNMSPLDYIKGPWNLAKALLEPQSESNVEERIKKGAKTIVIAGFGGVMRSAQLYEDVSGEKVIYLNSTNVDELEQTIKDAYAANGPVTVIPFSDGAKTADEYLSQDRGRGEVDHWYVLDANVLHADAPHVTYINGSKSLLAPLEAERTQKYNVDDGKNYWVNTGHAGFASDRNAVDQVMKIVDVQRN